MPSPRKNMKEEVKEEMPKKRKAEKICYGDEEED